ncbi:hypothetical protein GGG16DRAFT_84780, partial [Schizophyllum commune]
TRRPGVQGPISIARIGMPPCHEELLCSIGSSRVGEGVYKPEPLRVQVQAAPPSLYPRGRSRLQLPLTLTTSSPLNMGRSQAPLIAVRKTSNPEERGLRRLQVNERVQVRRAN